MSPATTLTTIQGISSFAIIGNCPISAQLEAAFGKKGIVYTKNLSEADYCLIWGDVLPPAEASGRHIFIKNYPRWDLGGGKGRGARHLFMGALFGQPVVEPILKQMVDSAITHSSLILPGDGMGKHYLTPIDQAISGIVEGAVNPRSPREIYLPGEEYSLLTLAYHLRACFPKAISISFEPDLSWEEASLPEDVVSSAGDRYLSQYLNWLITNNTSHCLPEVVPVAPPAQKIKLTRFEPATLPPVKLHPMSPVARVQFEPINKPRGAVKLPKLPKISFHLPKNLTRVLIVAGIATALYLTSILLSGIGLIYSLSQASQSLTSGQSQSYGLGRFCATYLEANLSALGVVPGLTTLSAEAMGLTTTANYIFDLAPDVAKLYAAGEGIATHLLGSTDTTDIVSEINSSRLLVEGTYSKLSQLEATLQNAPPSFLPSRYSVRYTSLVSALKTAKQHVLTGKAVLAILPDLIGVGERRKYALLLQNNMELRPTGGFIGSFALLSFENGRLYDLPVYDVYQADGQLKGHVEPPFPIKKYLGEANWYLRDSNWDPDFVTTADRVSWYIKKTLNQDVDGVIGINLSVIKTIIAALGELTVPEYDEVITAGNIYERTQYHAEVGFFPGSAQKKEFLGAMVGALMARLTSADTPTRLKVGEALLTSFSNQEITAAVTNATTQAVFKRLGWSGELKSTDCLINPCVNSYLSVVDANVGVNKANFYTSRDITLTIDLDKNLQATHTLRIKQNNAATSSAWPAGPYKNYQRLYLPPGAELISLSRDGIEIPSRDVDTTSEHGKSVLGYLVTTATSSASEIIATYRLITQTPETPRSLDFYWQKQPGTPSDPLTVIVNYPLFLTPSAISPLATTNSQQLIFGLENSYDRRIHIEFTHN